MNGESEERKDRRAAREHKERDVMRDEPIVAEGEFKKG
jgi:hypothetical protein